MEGRDRSRTPLLALAIALALAVVAAPAAAQTIGDEPYDPSGYEGGGGADGAAGGSGDYPDGSGAGSGRVEVTLGGKKKQRSLKAVKANAGCGPRACLLDARAKLVAGKRKARLKPIEDRAIAAGDRTQLRLKLTRKAGKVARRALRKGIKAKVKIVATGDGVGGGGSDSAKRSVRLAPRR